MINIIWYKEYSGLSWEECCQQIKEDDSSNLLTTGERHLECWIQCWPPQYKGDLKRLERGLLCRLSCLLGNKGFGIISSCALFKCMFFWKSCSMNFPIKKHLMIAFLCGLGWTFFFFFSILEHWEALAFYTFPYCVPTITICI